MPHSKLHSLGPVRRPVAPSFKDAPYEEVIIGEAEKRRGPLLSLQQEPEAVHPSENPVAKGFFWYARQDLNLRPLESESNALSN